MTELGISPKRITHQLNRQNVDEQRHLVGMVVVLV